MYPDIKLKQMKRIFYPLCAIALLASFLLVSCVKTVQYCSGIPEMGIRYTEVDNQTGEALDVTVYYLSTDNKYTSFSLDPGAKQTIDGDIRDCDSLVVASKSASSVYYGSKQVDEPKIKCDKHHNYDQRWLSFTITPSVFSK